MEPAPVDPTDESPQVRDNPARHRFEILLGDQVAGYLTYVERDGRLVFEHTVIADELEGRGLGSALARSVLDDMRAQGRRVEVECPFLIEWIRRHPEYGDLVAAS